MKPRAALAIVAALLVLGAGIGLLRAGRSGPVDCLPADQPPRIHPDYSDVVIPPNIAPLNFVIDEAGARFGVRIAGEVGPPVEIESPGSSVRIPLRAWKHLLAQNRGRSLQLSIRAQGPDGRWVSFQTITIRVAAEEVDRYVTYRLVSPVYFWFDESMEMGIYQRDLETFEERVVLHNGSFQEPGCFNCHTCAGNLASTMVIQLRGKTEPAMLLFRRRQEPLAQVSRVTTYPKGKRSPVSIAALHPKEEILAFAKLKLAFFSRNSGETREVFEYASDIYLYRFEQDDFISVPEICAPDYVETYPTWSWDGKWLYFCRTKVQWPAEFGDDAQTPPADYEGIRYDLMRISYDAESGKWGGVEPVLLAEDIGKSIARPTVSPDGRFVAVCLLRYGMWPLTHPESDLYLFDTTTRTRERMLCNSDQSESIPSWSTNGRWLLFVSKRKDGVLARLYLAHVDEQGNSSKGFEVPQKDPATHDALLKSYNVPQLMVEPMPCSERELVRMISTPASPDISTQVPTIRVGR